VCRDVHWSYVGNDPIQGPMPRITITQQTLVEHLINLQEQVDRCHSDALGFARDAGEVLLGVPPASKEVIDAAL